MKKIVTVITLLLAFTISANAQSNNDAQTKKSNSQEVVILSPTAAGQKDANALSDFLGLNDTQREDFARLFEMKHETMQNKDLSIERKKEMSRNVGLKIEASIDGTQLAKLKANTALYNQLIGANN
ncbi:hypothetical protein [Flavobacterium sp. GT3R68]|uniref:hypothetical protein n=1 Tax=Flavobacterium sp. GT3R68 TaxID=2594437 RepID=UPI000F86B4F1|nr:hypothetical protein [Flavobacterium sp. GT3R68]RTY90248.1 hypothetical protein EKL32_21505 [Flavobacterium sp. GSN2]TRW90549.1 hypothetical protein FNW07_11010 [Flavobacterium sp. GT3R68]